MSANVFSPENKDVEVAKDDGYRGIWYMIQPTGDAHGYKYSGGFATYPQQHLPIAVHAAKAHKTFFCYGGTAPNKNELLHLISYYDHQTGQVPRPTILLNKHTDDAHDNPTLALDEAGHLWIFSNAHGTERPAFIHKSKRPYDIDAWERVAETNFSYSQPWHLGSHGFLVLHTRYARGHGRVLHTMFSPDGQRWDEPQPLARMGQGHYQVSWRRGNRVATAFDYHPPDGGLNARTNLYYLETDDRGKTWRTANGTPLPTPLTDVQNPALVHDYASENLLVYLKDLSFDAHGHPVVLFLTSKGYAPGPANDPRAWHTARWTGKAWDIRPFTTSDHNYDHGSLYIEADAWRVLAPTDPGPQPGTTGGEVVLWTSRDQGNTWTSEKRVTRNSARNHTYVRRPLDAHPDFYALWADGNPLEPSLSHLYFTNRAASHVWRLPAQMHADFARPEPVS